MRILAAITVLLSLILAVNPQITTERNQRTAVLPDWSALLPAIPECETRESSVYDNKQGRLTQNVRYRRPTPDGMDIVVVGPDEDNCPSFTLNVTYPFTPPPTPPLTKEQRREQKKVAERMRKSEKKFRKLQEMLGNLRPRPLPPRSFVFKGFPALQYFGGSCDYTPCESDWVTSVSVQFSSDKTLLITVRGNFERTEEILNAVNFTELDAAMKRWTELKILESKK
jgi:hypothetical protein